MAAKRTATSDLNHENWNQDEEPEESGTFQRASDDSLKRRVIKTARRRNPISSVRDNGEDNDKKSAFTSFGGFGKASTPTTSAFSFLSNLTNPKTPPKVNGIEEKSGKSEISTFKFNSKAVTSASTSDGPDKLSETKLSWTKSEKITTNVFTPNSNANNNPSDNNPSEKSNDYYSKLKGLNQSVSNWIKKHVDTNPFINLQPIFKDYEKYFKELEKEKDLKPSPDTSKPENNKNEVSSMSAFLFKPTTNIPDSTTEKTQPDSKKADVESQKKTETNIPKFSFGSSITSTGNVSTTPSFSFGNTNSTGSGLFSFGTTTNVATKTTTETPSFTFGVKSNPTSTITTFNSSAPFTFANVAKPADEGEIKETDEEDEPPKNDFTPVIEKDYIYTNRCKIFVKKDDKFGDRGVGNLFLKPIQDSQKVQLIVRADTNLGNLLLNCILSESIPLKRLGKKDVMLVCVPTPDVAPPPVPVLLRVKNGEEADELLQTLEKHKK